MTKYFQITKRAVIAFILSFLMIFVMVGVTYAQESPEEIAQKYNVSFPIAELGSCSDLAACRTYCEDPVNSDACVSFAKAKGFYKEDALQTQKEQTLEKAKAALGCDSVTSCMNYCEVPENYEKCSSFAQSSNLSGGIVAKPDDAPILAKAQQVLGCNSADNCRSVCEEEANREKCAQFAKENGLRGGEHRVGPGGCTSEATCRSFCSNPDNFQVCNGFANVSGGNFSGPGGCSDEGSCRSYCQQNPNSCGNYQADQSGSPKYNPAEMCNRTPNCSWNGSTCECGFYGETKESKNRAKEYAEYCSSNSDKCKVGPGGYPVPVDKFAKFGTEGEDYKDYCQRNPERCRAITTSVGAPGTDGTFRPYEDPSFACSRYGCTWTGSSCQCSGIRDYDPAAACARATNCTWTGNSCQCSSPGGSANPYAYPTPGGVGGPGSCREPSGGCPSGWSWNASACSCNLNAGSTPPPGGCQQPPGGCPSGWSWSQNACSCNYTGGGQYSPKPYSYPTPGGPYSYPTPYGYTYPTPGGPYSYPTPYTYYTPYGYTYPTPGGPYSYPTPYSYQTPYSYSYPTPYSGNYSYPTPYSYSYPTPAAYSYPTPQAYSYPSPQAYSYPTPQQYSYPTPQAYSYPTPQSYQTPSGTLGVSTRPPSLLEQLLKLIGY